jgi:hypothetical protein
MGRRRGRQLTFAGRVAFGLAGRELLPRLEEIRQGECPFADKQPRNGLWVQPRLKAEVEYSTQSKPGQLRHAVLRQLIDPK